MPAGMARWKHSRCARAGAWRALVQTPRHPRSRPWRGGGGGGKGFASAYRDTPDRVSRSGILSSSLMHGFRPRIFDLSRPASCSCLHTCNAQWATKPVEGRETPPSLPKHTSLDSFSTVVKGLLEQLASRPLLGYLRRRPERVATRRALLQEQELGDVRQDEGNGQLPQRT